MSNIQVGNSKISVIIGEVIITDSGKTIDIPLHTVKSMLNIYDLKDATIVTTEQFEAGIEGWKTFSNKLNDLTNGDLQLLTYDEVSDVAKLYGITQISVKRAMKVQDGLSEADTNSLWVMKNPPNITSKKVIQVPIHKVLKNMKKYSSPDLMKWIKTNPIPTNPSAKVWSFKDDKKLQTLYGNFQGMYQGKDMVLTDAIKSLSMGKIPKEDAYKIESFTNNVSAEVYSKLKKTQMAMTTDGSSAVKTFCGSYYSTINGFLKGYKTTNTAGVQDVCKNMDKAFTKQGIKLDPNIYLYRSQTIEKEKLQNLEAGIVLPYDGYVSFTLRFGMATSWKNASLMNMFKLKGSYDTTVVFICKGFDKCLSLFPADISPHSGEHEIIANRGIGIKILRRLNKKDAHTNFYETEIVTSEVETLVESSMDTSIPSDIMKLIAIENELEKDPKYCARKAAETQNYNSEKWNESINFDDFE